MAGAEPSAPCFQFSSYCTLTHLMYSAAKTEAADLFELSLQVVALL